ncbi:hypothetical protein RugamoR64_48260 [Duganella rhizosphaerae]|uniref:c-type cytochrome n=1 Tax=Duganella rhizosphaerae TaxID=2885763 RepID=UPI0030E95BDD
MLELPWRKRYLDLIQFSLAGLSRYFAQQPAATGHSSDPVREKRGKAIFADGISSSGTPACASCHGAHGEGMGAFPRLAGQHADYVSKQLRVFQRTDERPDSPVMQSVAHTLTNDDIVSLASSWNPLGLVIKVKIDAGYIKDFRKQ